MVTDRSIESENLKPVSEEFEKQIAKDLGIRYAILCSSAWTAIQFSLKTLGIIYGDEVIIPDFVSQIVPITVFSVGAFLRFCDIRLKLSIILESHLYEKR